MDWDKLERIENETERTKALYEMFDENIRLNKSKAARVEFLTTVNYIEKYLTPDCNIIDIGAGAGEYSLHFAKQGYSVTAIELADNNIKSFQSKLLPGLNINLRQGDARDLSDFKDNSFDVVLLLGPLYHISDPAGRKKAIDEARRVCTPGGAIFFAYISNDMVILTETFSYNVNYLKNGDYNHETFAVNNFPFVFFTVADARDELSQIKVLHEVASDGISELLAEKINNFDDATYEQYLRYHFYCCEKPEMLGRSSHLLFVGRK